MILIIFILITSQHEKNKIKHTLKVETQPSNPYSNNCPRQKYWKKYV